VCGVLLIPLHLHIALLPLLSCLQATEHAQDTVMDADGFHQSTAKNVAHEGARTAVGRFSDETKTDEDVQKIKP